VLVLWLGLVVLLLEKAVSPQVFGHPLGGVSKHVADFPARQTRKLPKSHLLADLAEHAWFLRSLRI
jgi:hypothetical protein